MDIERSSLATDGWPTTTRYWKAFTTTVVVESPQKMLSMIATALRHEKKREGSIFLPKKTSLFHIKSCAVRKMSDFWGSFFVVDY